MSLLCLQVFLRLQGQQHFRAHDFHGPTEIVRTQSYNIYSPTVSDRGPCRTNTLGPWKLATSLLLGIVLLLFLLLLLQSNAIGQRWKSWGDISSINIEPLQVSAAFLSLQISTISLAETEIEKPVLIWISTVVFVTQPSRSLVLLRATPRRTNFDGGIKRTLDYTLHCNRRVSWRPEIDRLNHGTPSLELLIWHSDPDSVASGSSPIYPTILCVWIYLCLVYIHTYKLTYTDGFMPINMIGPIVWKLAYVCVTQSIDPPIYAYDCIFSNSYFGSWGLKSWFWCLDQMYWSWS